MAAADLQAELTTFRWLQLAVPIAAPTLTGFAFQTTTFGHFVLAPVSPAGLVTTGMLFMIKSPPASVGPATAGAGGFTVTPWLYDPGTGMPAAGAAFSASYDQMFTTFDFDAIPIYFQIGNVATPGNVFVGIAEQ